ncbi:YbhB/YbcL family Raf kinase inhibitor-like protein [Halocatena pleomorpha]|uniref:YbhB/YbcL family Raf kinase inhibitor-like protein n=1 Tax=Halocatena pleomorpha TaxID=1785090 RepID=A0A3P3RJV8_9EURY|nr:YbhB/YbcL family Raf kinase inhibitor-like protein [Halocatena pleomorpha]RRJ33692.1 YbhB/YbcL family Raf kinase inhibitor-like protein [Halocatena pleomorpha]
MSNLELTSPAFADGEPIPDEYSYTERNANPPLSIATVPTKSESLALIIDDPDARAPAGKVWDHWVVWNIDPDRTEIPSKWEPTEAIEGTNDYGDVGYGGPNPPDRRHTYRFKLYALDSPLNLQPASTKAAVENAMKGHIIAHTTLTGTAAP